MISKAVSIGFMEPEFTAMLNCSSSIAECLRSFSNAAMLDSDLLAQKVRLALARFDGPMREVAAACGVSVAAVSEWKRTGRIAKKHLPILARITRTPLEWWLSSGSASLPDEQPAAFTVVPYFVDDKEKSTSPSKPFLAQEPEQEKYVKLAKLQNSLGAGSVDLQEFDEVEGTHSFRRDWLLKKGWPIPALRVLNVKGNSMAPYINDGDIVLVNTAEKRLISGEVYAIASDGEAMVKRLFKQLDGKVRVESDNKEYPPDFFTPDRHGVILGLVVWRAG